MRLPSVTLLFAAVLVGGCGDSTTSQPTTTEGAVAAWKSAGLPAVELAATEGPGLAGGECRSGAMEGLELTLCEYATAEAARKAEAAGLKAVGAATGVALANDRLLLVIADRDGADPDGKRINTIARTFQGLESPPAE